jgi:hypothetical protein
MHKEKFWDCNFLILSQIINANFFGVSTVLNKVDSISFEKMNLSLYLFLQKKTNEYPKE